jgi:glycosyltransferase involved in cell wall biosynthesis
VSGLRFCFVTTFYPPYSLGGDGIAIERLAHALVARGCEVTVVHDVDAFRALSHASGPTTARADLPGLTIVPLTTRIGRLSLLLTHQLGRPVVHRRRLHELLEGRPFDVVVFHNVSLVGGPGLLSYGGSAARMYMAHEHWLVCQSHTLWRHNRELCDGRQCTRCALHYHKPPQVWRWTNYLEKQAGHVDMFVAMSEFSRAKHQEFGFSWPMEVLPFGLPPLPRMTGEDASPHERPYFLFAGRLERIKGLDDVIPAFSEYEAADLVIAGDGTDAVRLRTIAAGSPRVRFVGWLQADELDRYYRHALALIVPSVCYETFGIITIEAFRHGTPVIARRIGPFPEIVERAGAGELFTTRGELADALRRMQTEPARRVAMGRAGYEAYRAHYTEQIVVERFLQLAEQAIERRRRRSVA